MDGGSGEGAHVRPKHVRPGLSGLARKGKSAWNTPVDHDRQPHRTSENPSVLTRLNQPPAIQRATPRNPGAA